MPAPATPPRRPILPVCLAFVIGCVCGQLPDPAHTLRWYAAAAGLSAAVFWAATFRGGESGALTRVRALALCFVALIIAFFSSEASLRATEKKNGDFIAGVRTGALKAPFTGYVATEPVARAMGGGAAKLEFDFVVTRSAGEAITPVRLKADWWGSSSLANEHPPFPAPRAGEGWQLAGNVGVRKHGFGPAVPTLGVASRAWRESNVRDESADEPMPQSGIWRLRNAVSGTLARGAENNPRAVAITKAMSLGLRSDIPDEVRTFFRNSGTAHIFAISGLHVGIMAQIIMMLIGIFAFGPRVKTFVFIPLIIAYTVMTGAAPSAVRACVMTLLYYGAALFGRRPDCVSALCGAALLILAADPAQIADMSFVFSFVCTAGIIMMSSRIGLRFEGFNALITGGAANGGAPAANTARRRRKPSFWFGLLLRVQNSLSVSLAASLVSAPITAAVFQKVIPVAVFANLAVVPLSFCIVATAAASIVSGFASMRVAEIFNQANTVFCDAAVGFSEWCAKLPGGNFDVAECGAKHIAAYYAALFALLHFLPKRKPAEDEESEQITENNENPPI